MTKIEKETSEAGSDFWQLLKVTMKMYDKKPKKDEWQDRKRWLSLCSQINVISETI